MISINQFGFNFISIIFILISIVELIDCNIIDTLIYSIKPNQCKPIEYFDPFSNTCRPFSGGGRPIFVEHNVTCTNNFTGIKAYPDVDKFYYLCQSDSVVICECIDGLRFNGTSNKCEEIPKSPCNLYQLPECKTVGSFAMPDSFSCCYTCQKINQQLVPRLHACSATSLYSPNNRCTGSCKPAFTEVNNESSVHSTNDISNCYPPCTKPGQFRTPNNCSMYYTCSAKTNGRFYQTRLMCPPGFLYDITNEKCEPADTVNCKQLSVTELLNLYEYYKRQREDQRKNCTHVEIDKNLTENTGEQIPPNNTTEDLTSDTTIQTDQSTTTTKDGIYPATTSPSISFNQNMPNDLADKAQNRITAEPVLPGTFNKEDGTESTTASNENQFSQDLLKSTTESPQDYSSFETTKSLLEKLSNAFQSTETIEDGISSTVPNLHSELTQNILNDFADKAQDQMTAQPATPGSFDKDWIELTTTSQEKSFSPDLLKSTTESTHDYSSVETTNSILEKLSSALQSTVTIEDGISSTISNLPSELTQNILDDLADKAQDQMTAQPAIPGSFDKDWIELTTTFEEKSFSPDSLKSTTESTQDYSSVEATKSILERLSNALQSTVTIEDGISSTVPNLPTELTQNILNDLADKAQDQMTAQPAIPGIVDKDGIESTTTSEEKSFSPDSLKSTTESTQDLSFETTKSILEKSSTLLRGTATMEDEISSTVTNLPKELIQDISGYIPTKVQVPTVVGLTTAPNESNSETTESISEKFVSFVQSLTSTETVVDTIKSMNLENESSNNESDVTNKAKGNSFNSKDIDTLFSSTTTERIIESESQIKVGDSNLAHLPDESSYPMSMEPSTSYELAPIVGNQEQNQKANSEIKSINAMIQTSTLPSTTSADSKIRTTIPGEPSENRFTAPNTTERSIDGTSSQTVSSTTGFPTKIQSEMTISIISTTPIDRLTTTTTSQDKSTGSETTTLSTRITTIQSNLAVDTTSPQSSASHFDINRSEDEENISTTEHGTTTESFESTIESVQDEQPIAELASEIQNRKPENSIDQYASEAEKLVLTTTDRLESSTDSTSLTTQSENNSKIIEENVNTTSSPYVIGTSSSITENLMSEITTVPDDAHTITDISQTSSTLITHFSPNETDKLMSESASIESQSFTTGVDKVNEKNDSTEPSPNVGVQLFSAENSVTNFFTSTTTAEKLKTQNDANNEQTEKSPLSSTEIAQSSESSTLGENINNIGTKISPSVPTQQQTSESVSTLDYIENSTQSIVQSETSTASSTTDYPIQVYTTKSSDIVANSNDFHIDNPIVDISLSNNGAGKAPTMNLNVKRDVKIVIDMDVPKANCTDLAEC